MNCSSIVRSSVREVRRGKRRSWELRDNRARFCRFANENVAVDGVGSQKRGRGRGRKQKKTSLTAVTLVLLWSTSGVRSLTGTHAEGSPRRSQPLFSPRRPSLPEEACRMHAKKQETTLGDIYTHIYLVPPSIQPNSDAEYIIAEVTPSARLAAQRRCCWAGVFVVKRAQWGPTPRGIPAL